MERSEQLRRAALDRLRAGFGHQAHRLGREFVLLLGSPGATIDPSVQDHVGHELDVLAETARTFSLPEVQSSAAAAAAEVRAGRGVAALVPFTRALRGAFGTSRFAPLLVVARRPMLERLQADAERCVDAVVFFEDAEALAGAVLFEVPQAIVVPVEALGSLGPELQRRPVWAYGGGMASRLEAARFGAVGFLPERFEWRHLLERIRRRTAADNTPTVRALVAIDDESLRTRLAASLVAVGLVAAEGAGSRDPLALVDDALPEIVVVGHRSEDFVRVLRGHHRYADLPIVALADDAQEGPLLEAGADVVLRRSLAPAEIAKRVRMILQHARERAAHRDPVTSLRDRPGTLHMLDRAIADVRRGGLTHTVVLLELDVDHDATWRTSRAGSDYALRVLGRFLEGAVRSNDVVGRIGGDTLLLVLQGCKSSAAKRRIDDLRGVFASLTLKDERLAGIGFSYGLADTDGGTGRLLARVEESLERARAAVHRHPSHG